MIFNDCFKRDEILDFKNYNTWMYKFSELFTCDDSIQIIEKFKKVEEPLYLEDIIDILGLEIINNVEKYIIKNYTCVVFYHGSATDNIYSYLEHGLLPLNMSERNSYARTIFNQKDYSEITDEVFLNAVNELSKDEHGVNSRINKIYFIFDEDLLKESDSSHYLVYGGEHLLHLAQNLGLQYPRELEKKLTPIILKCKIPISLLNNEINNISKEIIIRYFENIVYPDYQFSVVGYTPYLISKVEPDCIIGCEFPKEIECELRRYN